MRTRTSFVNGYLVCCLLALLVVTAARGRQQEAKAGTAGGKAEAASTPLDVWDAKKVGEIHIEKIPAVVVIQRNIAGGYDKTNEAFVDLKRALIQQVKTQGLDAAAVATAAAVCYGVYPQDPDQVQSVAAKASGAVLGWTAAIPVPQGFRAPAGKAKALSVKAATSYKVSTLPATLAAVMFSTVGRAPVDGLKFFGWMADNGYVQVAPTRMLYYTKAGSAVSPAEMLNASQSLISSEETKIIVPIEKRSREISLKSAAETAKPPGR